MDTKQFEREVRNVRMKCKDAVDDPSSAACQSLISELQQLEDDAQVGKGVETIRAKLKSMRRTVERVSNSGGMSHGDVNTVKDWVDDTLQKIR